MPRRLCVVHYLRLSRSGGRSCSALFLSDVVFPVRNHLFGDVLVVASSAQRYALETWTMVVVCGRFRIAVAAADFGTGGHGKPSSACYLDMVKCLEPSCKKEQTDLHDGRPKDGTNDHVSRSVLGASLWNQFFGGHDRHDAANKRQ